MTDISTSIKRKTLKKFPSTNIHQYVQNVELKSRSEALLKEIWKEQRIARREDESLNKRRVVLPIETETWDNKNEKEYFERRKLMRDRLTQVIKFHMYSFSMPQQDLGIKFSWGATVRCSKPKSIQNQQMNMELI